jgi:hypothetical protein
VVLQRIESTFRCVAEGKTYPTIRAFTQPPANGHSSPSYSLRSSFSLVSRLGVLLVIRYLPIPPSTSNPRPSSRIVTGTYSGFMRASLPLGGKPITDAGDGETQGGRLWSGREMVGLWSRIRGRLEHGADIPRGGNIRDECRPAVRSSSPRCRPSAPAACVTHRDRYEGARLLLMGCWERGKIQWSVDAQPWSDRCRPDVGHERELTAEHFPGSSPVCGWFGTAGVLTRQLARAFQPAFRPTDIDARSELTIPPVTKRVLPRPFSRGGFPTSVRSMAIAPVRCQMRLSGFYPIRSAVHHRSSQTFESEDGAGVPKGRAGASRRLSMGSESMAMAR